MAAVNSSRVYKTLGGITAVKDLSFTVPEGCIYGLIGPNGAGKTTTMRLTVGLLRPDQGDIDVFGQPMSRNRSGVVGYLPEERGLYRRMTVRSLLQFHGQLRSNRDVNQEIELWLTTFGLTSRAEAAVNTLSKGMTQKVQFIASVIGKPPLLILDEPFSGLDPLSGQDIRNALLALRRDGTTIILSTHDMSVAETMCDRLLMILYGRKVFEGELAAIQHRFARDTLRIAVDLTTSDLENLPGVEHVREIDQLKEIQLVTGYETQQFLYELLSHGEVRHFSVSKPSLNDMFLHLASSGKGEDGA